MKLTEEQILKNKKIPTKEIMQDIKDTLREIEDFEDELKIFKKNPVKNKLAIYMREGKISTRRDFVETLNCILTYRNNNKNRRP